MIWNGQVSARRWDFNHIETYLSHPVGFAWLCSKVEEVHVGNAVRYKYSKWLQLHPAVYC